jgi:hypothetical protein
MLVDPWSPGTYIGREIGQADVDDGLPPDSAEGAVPSESPGQGRVSGRRPGLGVRRNRDLNPEGVASARRLRLSVG